MELFLEMLRYYTRHSTNCQFRFGEKICNRTEDKFGENDILADFKRVENHFDEYCQF
jgi:hypothetical protein